MDPDQTAPLDQHVEEVSNIFQQTTFLLYGLKAFFKGLINVSSVYIHVMAFMKLMHVR